MIHTKTQQDPYSLAKSAFDCYTQGSYQESLFLFSRANDAISHLLAFEGDDLKRLLLMHISQNHQARISELLVKVKNEPASQNPSQKEGFIDSSQDTM